MPKKPKKPPPTPVSSADVGDAILRESLEAIHDEIRGIRKGTVAPGKHDPISRIAWLAKNAASVVAEVRKAAAAEAKRVGSMRFEDVLAYIRQLPRDQRAHLLREGAAIDAGGSVLA